MAYLLAPTRLLVVMLCFHVSRRFHFSVADFKFGPASHLSNTISRYHLDTVSDEDLYADNFVVLCL